MTKRCTTAVVLHLLYAPTRKICSFLPKVDGIYNWGGPTGNTDCATSSPGGSIDCWNRFKFTPSPPNMKIGTQFADPTNHQYQKIHYFNNHASLDADRFLFQVYRCFCLSWNLH